jgi:RNA polymerase sigma-70 factor (ECF subfamily)
MLERFIQEYSERGFQFAYHLCGNAEEAKELVQEAFFRVIRRWDSYDPSQPLENWFLTILRNVFYDGVKRYERRHGVSLDAPIRDASGEPAASLSEVLADGREEALLERLEREEERDQVRLALEALSPDHKAVLTLCDMQGMSYEEVSAVLDCPLGTVRSRVSRARAAFKECLLGQTKEVPDNELR